MSDEAPIPPVGKRKRTRIIKSNRVQIFLFVLLTLVLTVATVWAARIYLKNSETLVFAVGDPNGQEARFANKLATMLKNNYSRFKVRIVSNGDNAKALAQFDRNEANLAVLRTDAKVPPRARAVAVLGDHDSWSAPEAIMSIHKECNWTFLDNEHRLFPYRGKNILVTGLTHIYSDRLAVPALREFLARAPKADLKILLVHQPAEVVIRLAAEQGYNLVLAGHTHGGQIVIHPLGIPFTPSMTETRYYQGVYTVDGTTAVVTRGVGLTLAPVRYHAPAEVTTLVLATDGHR